MIKVGAFKIEAMDLGEDHRQYFPGVTSGGYDTVVVGQGTTFEEAMNDCLENAAQVRVRLVSAVGLFEQLEEALREVDRGPMTPADEWPHDEWYRYVAVRWSILDDV